MSRDTPDLLSLRLVLLAAPLRERTTVGPERLERAGTTVERWRRCVAAWAGQPSSKMPDPMVRQAYAAVDDDLDMAGLLGVLDRADVDGELTDGAKFELFVHLDRFLGLDLPRYLGSALDAGPSARKGGGVPGARTDRPRPG